MRFVVGTSGPPADTVTAGTGRARSFVPSLSALFTRAALAAVVGSAAARGSFVPAAHDLKLISDTARGPQSHAARNDGHDMKVCQVYVRGESVYVITSWQTEPGFWYATEPMIKLGLDRPPGEVGARILEALNSSRTGVPVPANPKAVTQALTKFVGFKSWGTFAKGAVCFSVDYDGGVVRLIPTVSTGDGGFDHLPDRALICRPDAEEVGRQFFALLSEHS
ncbi:MAG: hypothetical protein ACRD68_00810 [Pyrinomonadaceae bacterium]